MRSYLRHHAMPVFVAIPLAAVGLRANVTGAEPRLTGAPGDSNCTECHAGTLNPSGGGVQIILPGPNTYTPGVKQHIVVQVSDAAQRRWGFEFTARLASNLSNGQAGSLASTDSFTQVECENGRRAPCSSGSVVQFITHTLSGTRAGTTGSVKFEFDWTPPDTDMGNIRFYAAGNAANGNNQNSGDHIYTTSVELTSAAAAPKPTINAGHGVVNAASLADGIAPNTWVTVNGANLATTTRTWTTDEIAGGALPQSLDKVSVTINNKPAYVQYVSPTKINVLSPADSAVGPVEVKVTSNEVASDPVVVELRPLAPAFFTMDGKYAATSTGENTLLEKNEKFYASGDAPAAFQAGDTITLYGTGFGLTDPVLPEGAMAVDPVSITSALNITVGGVQAAVASAGLVPGLPLIYRFSIVIPGGLAAGDQPVAANMDSVSSPAGETCCFLSIRQPQPDEPTIPSESPAAAGVWRGR
ncbi:MAG: hypothetical protein IT167_13410 [Bryobacterales bacterium]|nr:hypothetical protein [Bryobacterales bacterium]